jgi:hemerythrin
MDISSQLIWQDKQHQMLFELIDEIRCDSADMSIFSRLNDYAVNHFALEEEYMKRLNYPHAAAHIHAHDKFRRELEALVEFRHEYDETVKASLSLFLTEWLQRHIYGIDKKLEKFVLESHHK